jgi:hypothetical protein
VDASVPSFSAAEKGTKIYPSLLVYSSAPGVFIAMCRVTFSCNALYIAYNCSVKPVGQANEFSVITETVEQIPES